MFRKKSMMVVGSKSAVEVTVVSGSQVEVRLVRETKSGKKKERRKAEMKKGRKKRERREAGRM